MFRRNRPVFGQRFDLDDDHAATGFGCQGHGQEFHADFFIIRRYVAIQVGAGPVDDSDVDGERFVPEIFFAVQFLDFYQVFLSDAVQFPAFDAGVDEGIEADTGKQARFAAGNAAEPLGHRALRQVVAFDLIVHDQFPQFGSQVVMTGNNPFQHAFVGEMAGTLAHTVTDAGRMDQCQLLRISGLGKAVFQGLQYFFRQCTLCKTTNGDSRTIFNKRCCIFCCNQFCHDDFLLIDFLTCLR